MRWRIFAKPEFDTEPGESYKRRFASIEAGPRPFSPSMARSLPGILIVDDQQHMLRLLEYNLRPLKARLHFASNAREAREIARREGEGLDLAVLDYELPDGNGCELLAQFKQMPVLRNLKVLMLTAQGQASIRFEAESLGVNVFLTKPFSPRELLCYIRDLIDENVPVS